MEFVAEQLNHYDINDRSGPFYAILDKMIAGPQSERSEPIP